MAEPNASRIEAARKLIAEAKASGKFGATRPKTKQDEVRLLREDIEGLRSEGATWEQVAELLRPVLHAGPDTIRLAIGGAKKTLTAANRKTKTPAKRKRSKGEPVAELQPRHRRRLNEAEQTTQPQAPAKRFGTNDADL